MLRQTKTYEKTSSKRENRTLEPVHHHILLFVAPNSFRGYRFKKPHFKQLKNYGFF